MGSNGKSSKNTVDTEKLAEYITRLDTLKGKIVDYPQTFLDAGNSAGMVFEELENIKQVLERLNNAMELLVSNTSSYMKGRLESVNTKEQQHTDDVKGGKN